MLDSPFGDGECNGHRIREGSLRVVVCMFTVSTTHQCDARTYDIVCTHKSDIIMHILHCVRPVLLRVWISEGFTQADS